MPEGRLAQLGAVAAEDGQPPARVGDDLDGAAVRARLAGDRVGETGRVRGTDDDARAQPGAREVGGVLVGDEAAFVDGDDAIGGAGGLFGVAGGVENGAAVRRVRPEQSVQPAVLAGRETGGRFVEDERVRVAQQRGGEAESAVHAEGEGAEGFVAQGADTDEVEQGVGARGAHARGGAEHAQLPSRGTRGVPRHIAEKHADLAGGVGDAVERPAPEVGDAAAGFEFEHEPQGGGLAGAVGAEERSDATGPGLEGQIVHGGREVAVGVAGESDGLEHRFSRGEV